MTYSGGRGFFGQGRYVEESRENKRGNCDSGRKIEVAMDVDKLDITKRTAEIRISTTIKVEYKLWIHQ